MSLLKPKPGEDYEILCCKCCGHDYQAWHPIARCERETPICDKCDIHEITTFQDDEEEMEGDE